MAFLFHSFQPCLVSYKKQQPPHTQGCLVNWTFFRCPQRFPLPPHEAPPSHLHAHFVLEPYSQIPHRGFWPDLASRTEDHSLNPKVGHAAVFIQGITRAFRRLGSRQSQLLFCRAHTTAYAASYHPRFWIVPIPSLSSSFTFLVSSLHPPARSTLLSVLS
jgi:hypothetical protein